MPKEKEQGERVPRMASKNAKEKSNSATLLAVRAKAQAEQEARGRSSHCSSEKDSGYSDTGSDSLHGYQRSRQSKARDSHQVSHQGNAMLMPGTSELTPIFIIKNVVLKQPVPVGQEQLLQAPLPWGGAGTNDQGSTHVLLLQQPEVTSQAPMHILKPQPRRADGGGKKSKATYLPILNSYPRIAPHPSKKTDKTTGAGGGANSRSSSLGGGGGGGTAEGHGQSKRVCTEEKREEVSTTSQLQKKHVHKQPERRAHSHASHFRSHSSSQDHFLPGKNREIPSHMRRSPHPPSSPSTSASLGSPSVSSTETASPPSSHELAAPLLRSSKGQHRQNQQQHKHNSAHGSLSFGSGHHRRFLNTVQILCQSGLLDLTLRTQELLRQSSANERDIAQLRQHTQLLCQAAQTYPASPDAWVLVHQSMVESGHYPSLGLDSCGGKNSHCSPPAQVQAEADTSSGGNKADVVVSLALSHNRHEEMAPPSPLLAPMDDISLDLPALDQNGHTALFMGQSMGQGTIARSLDDLLMPPDSSTHSHLL
ncbi:CLOCK-interacting pacemaker [Clupea harengus]|uniref:CLOCK-interacting pacemaker n=1 Tax=Clupea harengus TaxID=7950 RepID=A0A6P3VWF3_CLUHA|nr:CLOCK-interacting pacemaker [Clupea harengus]